MKVFYTTSTQHLRIKLPFDYGKALITRFSDGEIFVEIEEDVHKKKVWIIAATPAPADNYFELFFLLDALQRAGAQVNLLITYFGYARQDRVGGNEALGAQVISNFLKNFITKKTVAIHVHSKRLHDYLTFENYIPYDLFYPIAQKADIIVAPDFGAKDLAETIGKKCNKQVIVAEKKHPAREQVEIMHITENVKNKKILIVDDMIATGNTIMTVAEKLITQGAHEVNVMATHGIFAGNAQKKLTESNIKNIYVTNTLKQPFAGKKVTVIDISSELERRLNNDA